MNVLDLLAAVVRGDTDSWPEGRGSAFEKAFLSAADAHRVEALVAWHLWRAGTFDAWPERIRTELARVARQEVALEAGRVGEVRRVTEALARAGLPCLLMKGVALAYSRYPEPWMRSRSDNDMLVRPDDAAAAGRVMTELGYKANHALAGQFVSNQLPYWRIDRLGLRHVVDVHWKISNRPLFADRLSFDELWARAVRVPALGPDARALGDVHELTLACFHPVAHHRNAGDLQWTYDIHLLASRFGTPQFDELAALARERRLAAICASGLTRAIQHFHTDVPAHTLASLAVVGEDSEAFLGAAPWRGDVRLSDLRMLSGWRAKLQLIREVALPGSDYMLRRYACSTRLLIPALHVHRLTRGTWRLLRRFAQ